MTDKPLYPKHSLGEHIVRFDLVFNKSQSVENTLSGIQKLKGSWPNSESIYVVDDSNKLVGVVDFKNLLSAKADSKLSEIMNRKFESVTSHSHQNTAINIAVKKGVESIPVVDNELHFLGILDAGAIFKIMHEEHIDKLMNFSGILTSGDYTDMLRTKVSKLIKERLPWLLFGLLGGIFATIIVEKYELVLKEVVALAFFIPVIVYINDAVGTQTQTIFVRLSALETVPFKKYFLQELKIALVVGASLSALIFVFILFWFRDPAIGAVVGLSMLCGIISSVFIGTFFPWLLQKMGKDPAIGSGPFTTIIQDLLSILIYFSIASFLF